MSRGKRLLVGAISYADAEPALQIANALLAGEISELRGLLVEDEQGTEALPHHLRQVVTVRGAICTAPEGGVRRRLRESDAKAFREGLQRIVGASEVSWEFSQERGEPMTRLVRAAQASDMLMIGHRRLVSLPGPVVSILPASGDVASMQRVSQTLANAMNTGLLELEQDQSDAALLARINRTCATAVIVDATFRLLDNREHLGKLLAAARCPVLVLGARNMASAKR